MQHRSRSDWMSFLPLLSVTHVGLCRNRVSERWGPQSCSCTVVGYRRGDWYYGVISTIQRQWIIFQTLKTCCSVLVLYVSSKSTFSSNLRHWPTCVNCRISMQEAPAATEHRNFKNHGSLATEYGVRNSMQNQLLNQLPHRPNLLSGSRRLMAEPSTSDIVMFSLL